MKKKNFFSPLKIINATVVAAAVIFAPALRADFLQSVLTRDVQVMTVTDIKPDGKSMPIPSRDHPIYYEGINAGFKDWGRAMANDDVPNNKLMQDAVVRALAKNGYRSADATHEATQIIVMSWGTFYGGHALASSPAALKFLAGDKFDMSGEVDGSTFSPSNVGAEYRIIPKFSESKLREIANGNLYVALLRAYSVRSANNGKIAQLWETRIACPSDGLALDQTLPKMIQLAAPNIGLDTVKPVWSSPMKNLHEHIETGEIRVVDDVDVEKAHVTNLNELLAPEKPADKKVK